MNRSRYSILAVPVLAFAAILMLNGCGADGKHIEAAYNNPIKDEFTAGKDRVPTAKTLFAMSRILVARNRDAQAEFVLDRILRDHPEFLSAYIELAELQMRNDATEEAMETLRAGLAIAPENAAMLNNLGVCAMVSEDYESATTHFLAAMDAAPHIPRHQANLGVAMALMRDYDGALEVMRGVLSEQDAHTNLAAICMANGDEQRARDELRLAQEAR